MAAGPRLELTWPNKDRFLLVPKDDQGKPVWVERDHPAANEVRLTREIAAVGEVGPDPHADNTVFIGDSLDALRVMAEVPEYAATYRGKVKLIYADPPFNTGQTFTHYDDWMEHSVWLSFMRERLLLMRDLLAADGSVWIHLDDAEVHRMRCLMDEVFGAGQFINQVVWKRTNAKSGARRGMATMHDCLLVYGKTPTTSLQAVLLPYDQDYIDREYQYEDEKGRYSLGDLTAPGVRSGDSGKDWRGRNPAAAGRHWIGPGVAGITTEVGHELTTREKLDALDAAGFIHWRQTPGSMPRFKRYLNPDGGIQVGDLWTDIEIPNSRDRERVRFNTQKPERLVERVLAMASREGDLVLDPFAGSGTTAAVAHKMGRHWVAVELSEANADGFTTPRLTRVVEGRDLGGITDIHNWTGGGGFRVVAVEPSLFEVGPGGMVLLRDDISNDDLARAMCGQLRFAYTPDDAPLVGRRGRMRLAVFSGVIGEEEIDDLLGQLDDAERLTVVAAGFLPGAADHLGSKSKGSRALKVPRDVLTATLRRTQRDGEET